MIAFVREHADRFGVEAICRTLGATVGGFITARGYRAAVARPRSARSISDQVLGAQIVRLHEENYSVYGVRKMHAAMRRAGWVIGRDQTGRIMAGLGLTGVRRGRKTFTTRSDAAATRPADLVQRHFHPDAPRRLWVADITYVATWSGFAYVAFVIDAYSRRIVGWNVAATLKAEVLPLQALDMAAWQAGGDLSGLTHHSDHGNYMSLVYTDRVVQLGAVGSTGTVGDSYDCQRPGRDCQRPVQDRADPPARSLAHCRTRRAGHPRVGLVVEQLPAALRDRLLRSPRLTLGSTRYPRPPLGTKPSAVHSVSWGWLAAAVIYIGVLRVSTTAES